MKENLRFQTIGIYSSHEIAWNNDPMARYVAIVNIAGLVHGRSISIASVLEILQSCT